MQFKYQFMLSAKIIIITIIDKRIIIMYNTDIQCGYIYDPAVGDPDAGIAPETAFEDIPDDWTCPICGLGKDVFVPVED